MVWFVKYENEEEVMRQNVNMFRDERQGKYR